MNFQLTEDRLALQQAVREFAEKELAPGVIERDEKSEYPDFPTPKNTAVPAGTIWITQLQ